MAGKIGAAHEPAPVVCQPGLEVGMKAVKRGETEGGWGELRSSGSVKWEEMNIDKFIKGLLIMLSATCVGYIL